MLDVVRAFGQRPPVGVAQFQADVALAVLLDVGQRHVLDERFLGIEDARLIHCPGAVGELAVHFAVLARGQDHVAGAVRFGKFHDFLVAHFFERFAMHQFRRALGVIQHGPQRRQLVPPVLGEGGAEVKLRAVAPLANHRAIGIDAKAPLLWGCEEERFFWGGSGGPPLHLDPGVLPTHIRAGERAVSVQA